MAETTIFVAGSPVGVILRQIGLLIGIAAAVAIGVAVVLWSQTPNYSLLYGSLSDRDISQVNDALLASGIPYKIDHASGAVLVPSSQVYDARLKLAAAGLPKSASMGLEMLNEKQEFGTSQLMETARYQRALEGELARTIGRLSNVREAHVQVALPKQSVFARDRREPSASVFVELYPGRRLEEGQVVAIVNLVSASIPNLLASNVVVVNQDGELLARSGVDPEMQMASERFQHTAMVEGKFKERIEKLLAPLVGEDGVRAQVTAEMDFTNTARRVRQYNPDLPAVRSEQTSEENRTGPGEGGIPGALSNQPPGAASVPETTAATPGAATPTPGAPVTTPPGVTQMTRKAKTTNNEIDDTWSYVQEAIGTLRKLSVAVVVKNPVTADAQGKPVAAPLGAEGLQRFTDLVKQAVGFDPLRGDTVTVTSADFLVPPLPEPLPELPIWKQPWLWDVTKQVLGGLFALIVVLGVLRPTLRTLVKREPVVTLAAAALPGQSGAGAALAGPGGGLGAAVQLGGPGGYQSELDRVKSYVTQDPRLAAQVVKNWVGADG